MQIYSRTHKGLVRETNQDAILSKEDLFGVADGMGGHLGGDTASKLAVQVVTNMLSEKDPAENTLRIGVEAANRRIYERQKHEANLRGMGTTLTLVWESKEHVLLAHVGDSRAYLLRDEKLKCITQDHSMVGELLRNKAITEEEAKVHPYRNIITRALGTSAVVEVDIINEDKKPGDVWLLCSDGLYNKVEDTEIQKILQDHDLETAIQKLLDLTLKRGAEDNVSILIGHVSEVAEA